MVTACSPYAEIGHAALRGGSGIRSIEESDRCPPPRTVVAGLSSTCLWWSPGRERDDGAGSFSRSRPRGVSGPDAGVSLRRLVSPRETAVQPGRRASPAVCPVAGLSGLQQAVNRLGPLVAMSTRTGTSDLAFAFAAAPLPAVLGIGALALLGLLALGVALHQPRYANLGARSCLWRPLTGSAAVLAATVAVAYWLFP